MKRPILREIPVASVEVGLGKNVITINPGAWDKLIQECYDVGWTLLVIKADRPIKAYRKLMEEIKGHN